VSSFEHPRAIAPSDSVTDFDCGEPTLNNWITLRALKNEKAGASRTFVSIESESGLVAGYYCLSAGSLAHDEAGPRLRRNTPDPIPIVLIGRLAVDARFKGRGLGASLLQDAVMKGIEASRIVGSRAIVVHALSESAATFYRRFGFTPMPGSSKAMYLLTQDAEATVTSL
jgi:GNAT superfamily N-acetyltransferase